MELPVFKLRYEEPSYIEEYVAELANPIFYPYRRKLEFGIIMSRYFRLKNYPNFRKKSIIILPPRAYYGAISLSEQDLEWKLRFGPYAIRRPEGFAHVEDSLRKKLALTGVSAREEAIDLLLARIEDSLSGSYYHLIYRTLDMPE